MSNANVIRPWSEPLEWCDRTAKTEGEEWANALTHGLGFGLSLLASVALLQRVVPYGSVGRIVATLIYTSSMVSLYAVSTLSHWVQHAGWKSRFRAWDQGLIYLFIAGNFTPFTVTCFQGWWHLITAAVWTLALAGCLSKVAFRHRVDGIALWMYLGLGWLTALGLPQLYAVAPVTAAQLTLAGGIAYSLGTVLLMHDHRAPFLHVGWHLLVIAGSAFHYLAVWQCVLMPT